MSVLIKGMEMPKTCADCKLILYANGEYICPFSGIMALNIGRQDDCPLVEVKTPHGRIVDIDMILNGIYKEDLDLTCGGLARKALIIEAEEEA